MRVYVCLCRCVFVGDLRRRDSAPLEVTGNRSIVSALTVPIIPQEFRRYFRSAFRRSPECPVITGLFVCAQDLRTYPVPSTPSLHPPDFMNNGSGPAPSETPEAHLLHT